MDCGSSGDKNEAEHDMHLVVIPRLDTEKRHIELKNIFQIIEEMIKEHVHDRKPPKYIDIIDPFLIVQADTSDPDLIKNPLTAWHERSFVSALLGSAFLKSLSTHLIIPQNVKKTIKGSIFQLSYSLGQKFTENNLPCLVTIVVILIMKTCRYQRNIFLSGSAGIGV